MHLAPVYSILVSHRLLQFTVSCYLDKPQLVKVLPSSSYVSSTMSRRRQGSCEQFQALATQLVPSISTNVSNCDITGLAKCPPEKQTSPHWSVETLYIECSRKMVSFGILSAGPEPRIFRCSG